MRRALRASAVRLGTHRWLLTEPVGAQDCCLVFWPCSAPFAAAQMLTQEGLRKPNYALFSKDGGEVSGKLMAVVPV